MGKPTAIVPRDDGDNFLAQFRFFSANLDQLSEMLEENLGGTLTLGDLRRISVPAAGGVIWKVPDANAEKGYVNLEALTGIIVYHRIIRAYWRTAYAGGKEPPSCYSVDGKYGVGDPGGRCVSCPFNQFGSAVRSGKPSRGKACAEKDQLFVLRPNSVIPIIINVPPSSLRNVRSFFADLLDQGLPYWAAVVSIELQETKSSDGVAYSEVVFRKLAEVPAEKQSYLAKYKETIKDMVKTTSIAAEDYAETEAEK